MRAALLTRFRAPLEIAELADPPCPPDGVVLEVLACGICRSDWHGWTGADPDISLPHVPGHEYCGIVVEAGPLVRRWRPGDRVIAPFILACGTCADCAAGHQTVCADQVVPGFTAPGAFAERIAVARADANLAALPEGLDPALAAALGCRVTTVWHALTDRAALAPGEWLAVHGAGGVGLSAVMLGMALGARVVATDPVAEKRALAERLGARTLDPAAEDAAEAIREITGGGAHVAIDALGIQATVRAALASLRPLGRHVQIGMPAGAAAQMTLPMDLIYARQLALYATRGMPAHRFAPLLGLLSAGRLDIGTLVTRRVALREAGAELAAMDGPTPPGIAVITRFGAAA